MGKSVKSVLHGTSRSTLYTDLCSKLKARPDIHIVEKVSSTTYPMKTNSNINLRTQKSYLKDFVSDFNYEYMRVFECGFVGAGKSACRGQRMRVLGPQLGSSASTVSTLNCRALSPAPRICEHAPSAY